MTYRDCKIYCKYCDKEICYSNFASHCKTKKHNKNYYDSPEAKQERLEKKIEDHKERTLLCLAIKKLTVEEKQVILKRSSIFLECIK
jgi:hypothetical protein